MMLVVILSLLAIASGGYVFIRARGWDNAARVGGFVMLLGVCMLLLSASHVGGVR